MQRPRGLVRRRLESWPCPSEGCRPVTVRVPAKVNLQLSVGAAGRRLPRLVDGLPRGQPLRRGHRRAGPAAASASRSRAEGAGRLPIDGRNLAVRAVRALAERAGVAADVQLHLRKDIPVAGGMAGGSADAAAALVACDALWGCTWTPSELADLAAGLGADVPFALLGGTALGVGTGEQLTPALARGRFHWVFALADGGLSTPDGLRGVRPAGAATRVRPEPRCPTTLMAALRAGDAAPLGAALQRPAAGGAAPAPAAALHPRGRAASTARSGARRLRLRADVRVPRPRRASTRSTSRWRCRRRACAGPSGGPTARSPAPASSRRRPRRLGDGVAARRQPGQPRGGAARRTAPASCSTACRSASPTATGSASSAATAAARPRCSRCWPGRGAGRRPGHAHRRAAGRVASPRTTARAAGDRAVAPSSATGPSTSGRADPRIREVLAGLLGGRLDLDAPGRAAVRRRAAPGRAGRRCSSTTRTCCARRADQPPRRRGRRLAGQHLAARRGALVVVTHDRWFLDAVCTAPGRSPTAGVQAYDGGYAAYVLARAERERPATPRGRAGATCCARSSPGCAAARRRARPSRSSASTRPTR